MDKRGTFFQRVILIAMTITLLSFTMEQEQAMALDISGTIYDKDGAVISDPVCVTALTQISGGTSSCDLDWNNPSGGTSSAGDGSYNFTVDDGEYYLFFDPKCGNPNSTTFLAEEFYTLDNDGTTDCGFADSFTAESPEKNITLEAGGRITGTLTGTSGQEVCINIEKLRVGGQNGCDTEYVAGGWTGTGGSFSIIAPAGVYYLKTYANCPDNTNNLVDEYWTPDGHGTPHCNQAVPFSISANEEKVRNLELEEGAVMSGKISGANGQKVCVNAFTLRDNGQNGCDTDWFGGTVTKDNDEYSYVAPPGDYYLQTYAYCSDDNSNVNYLVDEHWTTDGEGAWECWNAEKFTVTVGSSSDKDIALESGGKISGTVTTDPPGGDLSNVEVIVKSENMHWLGSTSVNPDGSYTTNIVPTGNNYIQFTDGNGFFQEEYFDQVPTWNNSDATPISVSPITITPNINVTLKIPSNDRYYPDWASIGTSHFYDNSSMTTKTKALGYIDLRRFSDRKTIIRDLFNSSLTVTKPTGTCSNDSFSTDTFWRVQRLDNNNNGIIEEDEKELPHGVTYIESVCTLGDTPHDGGTYTFNLTLPNATILSKTLTGVSAGHSLAEMPPVTGLTASWDNTDNELDLSWTLPGITYPSDTYIEIRIYFYNNGHYLNNQIRIRNLPVTLSEFSLDPGLTSYFDTGKVNQLVVQVKIRERDWSSTTTTSQAYSFNHVTHTLTEEPIAMKLLDVNGDNRTGLAEAIYSLQAISGN